MAICFIKTSMLLGRAEENNGLRVWEWEMEPFTSKTLTSSQGQSKQKSYHYQLVAHRMRKKMIVFHGQRQTSQKQN